MPAKVSTVGEVLGRRVRLYREGLEWRQEDLAAEASKLGHPMNRVTLSNIERAGTRAANVSLVDTMVLAAALNVPPPLLFLPLGEEDKVAITPAVKVHPHLVLDWITGEGPFVYSNRRARDLKTWSKHSTPMWLFQELHRRQRAAQEAENQTRFAEGERVAVAVERFNGTLRQLNQHISYMKREGLRVPEMPPEWRDRMEQLRDEEEG